MLQEMEPKADKDPGETEATVSCPSTFCSGLCPLDYTPRRPTASVYSNEVCDVGTLSAFMRERGASTLQKPLAPELHRQRGSQTHIQVGGR